MKTLGKAETTARGFEVIRFDDIAGEECRLQQSSIALCAQPGAGAVWVGLTEHPMHLDRKQVRALRRHLGAWLKTGSLAIHDTEEDR